MERPGLASCFLTYPCIFPEVGKVETVHEVTEDFRANSGASGLGEIYSSGLLSKFTGNTVYPEP